MLLSVLIKCSEASHPACGSSPLLVHLISCSLVSGGPNPFCASNPGAHAVQDILSAVHNLIPDLSLVQAVQGINFLI